MTVRKCPFVSSGEIIRQGRVLRISDPHAGSSETSQTKFVFGAVPAVWSAAFHPRLGGPHCSMRGFGIRMPRELPMRVRGRAEARRKLKLAPL
jgi:hypothetical protein